MRRWLWMPWLAFVPALAWVGCDRGESGGRAQPLGAGTGAPGGAVGTISISKPAGIASASGGRGGAGGAPVAALGGARAAFEAGGGGIGSGGAAAGLAGYGGAAEVAGSAGWSGAGAGGSAAGAVTSADAGLPPHAGDSDGDGRADAADNCPEHANAAQYDLDGDGVGTACDPDDEVVARGALTGWSEAETRDFDVLAGANGSGLVGTWSVGDATLAYVYARAAGVEVAAPEVTSFAQISDASTLVYSADVARLDAGEVAVLRNTATGTYAALRFESAAYDGQVWRATMSWLFAGHSPHFAALP